MMQGNFTKGTVIGGHFLIEEVLSNTNGGMSSLRCKVIDQAESPSCPEDRKYYFAKVLLEGQVGNGQNGNIQNSNDYLQYKEKLSDEAAIMQQLNHPSIPQVKAYFSQKIHDKEMSVLITDFIAGKTLEDLLMEQPDDPQGMKFFAPNVVVDWTLQLCDALEYCHNRKNSITMSKAGVIQRDIKTPNLMLDEKGHIRLVDFGISKTVDSCELTRKDTKFAAFSDGFSPIEAYSTKQKPEPSRDIYSVGAVMYRLLTGETLIPAIEIAADPSIVFPRPGAIKDAALENIVSKCLKFQAKDRYQTMASIRKDLALLQAASQIIPAVKQTAPLVNPQFSSLPPVHPSSPSQAQPSVIYHAPQYQLLSKINLDLLALTKRYNRNFEPDRIHQAKIAYLSPHWDYIALGWPDGSALICKVPVSKNVLAFSKEVFSGEYRPMIPNLTPHTASIKIAGLKNKDLLMLTGGMYLTLLTMNDTLNGNTLKVKKVASKMIASPFNPALGFDVRPDNSQVGQWAVVNFLKGSSLHNYHVGKEFAKLIQKVGEMNFAQGSFSDVKYTHKGDELFGIYDNHPTIIPHLFSDWFNSPKTKRDYPLSLHDPTMRPARQDYLIAGHPKRDIFVAVSRQNIKNPCNISIIKECTPGVDGTRCKYLGVYETPYKCRASKIEFSPDGNKLAILYDDARLAIHAVEVNCDPLSDFFSISDLHQKFDNVLDFCFKPKENKIALFRTEGKEYFLENYGG